MLFTVELHSIPLRLRLQKDGTWRDCTKDSDKLQSTDFTSDNPSVIAAKSTATGTIIIEGKMYDVDPMMSPSEHDPLNHSSSVFRNEYPDEPTLEQLRSTIAAGDDGHLNLLILNVNAQFELRQRPFKNGVNDPTIVVRYASFGKGGGYVGRVAARNDAFMSNLFRRLLAYWARHLVDHSTQDYADIPVSPTVEQSRRKLSKIRSEWKADY